VSTVAGHAGRLVAGYVADVPVVVLQGRVHGYEGYSPLEVTWAVRVMAGLGARGLFLTNAAGAMTTALRPGDLMLVRDHVNLSFSRLVPPADLLERVPRTRGGAGEGADPFGGGVYAERLGDCAREAACTLGLALREGVLVLGRGPTYETPAEVALYRRAGDAACMSTVPEAIAGRLLGLEVLALSCISNLGTGLSPSPLTHDEVTTIAAEVSGRFRALLTETIRRAYGNGG
jgi:purine-nucleoside phosphorylase